MNENLTELIFLLDRSGSMSGLESDTIGGYNGLLEQQAEVGDTRVTTVLFDDKYELLYHGVSTKKAVLKKKQYFVRGSTALLDAVGKTIVDIGNRLSETNESARPGKVIFVITTDGMENASREYTYDKIKEMIEHQKEKYNWEFIFMGANIDVAEEGKKYGINPDMAIAYESTAKGTALMWMNVSAMTTGMRNSFLKKKK